MITRLFINGPLLLNYDFVGGDKSAVSLCLLQGCVCDVARLRPESGPVHYSVLLYQ